MLNFMAWQFCKALHDLHAFEQIAEKARASNLGNRHFPDEDCQRIIAPKLAYCRQQCDRIDLPAARERLDIFERKLKTGITFDEIGNQAIVLREAIEGELKFRRFAFVPTDKARILDGMGHVWEKIWDTLPSIKHDSQEAIYCYALGRDTACVFHLMRVTELALRILSRHLKVQLKRDIDVEDWKAILDGLKKKLEQLNNQARTKQRKKQIEIYAQMSAEFSFFKDAWRHHVSHARTTYDGPQALSVMNHVHGLMLEIVEHVPKKNVPCS